MAKAKTQFTCQQCAAVSRKWTGRCDNCGSWNSLVEQPVVDPGKSVVAKSASSGQALKVQLLQDVDVQEGSSRLTTGIKDLDAEVGS